MNALLTRHTATAISGPLLGSAPDSTAGPVESVRELTSPPRIGLPALAQTIYYGQRQASFMFRYQRRYGDVFRHTGYISGDPVITSHPAHAQSLFTAKQQLVPTLAAESPLRPILGPASVLTANGPRHLRQRKLLLPPFHGEAIARYEEMITAAVQREIARWPTGRPFALAPRMQAITLDVIMGGIFGITDRPKLGTLEYILRFEIRNLLWNSMLPVVAKLAELMNIGHDEPFGLTWLALAVPDRVVRAVIRKRRTAADLERRSDILSLIMRARTESGEALTDQEIRDELMTLVLAGHETTANQLAWTWERLARTPEAYARLVDTVRGASDSDARTTVEATITEGMRVRPVIPVTGRRVATDWRLGEYGVPAGTPVSISILLLHHREDLYPDPFSFRPERWLAADGTLVKPGTYTWLPFGGGTRRCLGAALAMAEQRIVLREMVSRLDIAATDKRGERPMHRNVTMIPSRGGRITVTAKR